MLKVAGVANLVVNNFDKPIDDKTIIAAALLHDMGNVVKFNFDLPESWFSPLGKKYWKDIQNEFIEKYGNNDHDATAAILNEIAVDEKIKELVNNIGFSKSENIKKSSDFNIKILSYSDQRVSPQGVVSMEERYIEAQKRYSEIIKKYTYEEFEYLKKQNFENASQIFEHCRIKPEDITEEKVLSLIPSLRDFEIKT